MRYSQLGEELSKTLGADVEVQWTDELIFVVDQFIVRLYLNVVGKEL